MQVKRNLIRTVPTNFDVTTLLYPRDKFDLIRVDYVDTWDIPREYDTREGKKTRYVKLSSVTVTLRCRKCGTVKTVVDKATIGCKEGPCNVAWKDWTGHRFGRLVALEYVPLENRRKSKWKRKAKWYWKCQCDCGRIYYKDTHDLIVSGHIECGYCARQHAVAKTTLPDDLAKWHREYRACKKNALTRHYEFSLSFEQYKSICEQPCYYCGAAPDKHSCGIYKNGVDRFDNAKGYTVENCVPCCRMCNTIKLDYDYTELIEHLNQMLKIHKKRSTTIPKGSTPKRVETDSPEKEDIV